MHLGKASTPLEDKLCTIVSKVRKKDRTKIIFLDQSSGKTGLGGGE